MHFVHCCLKKEFGTQSIQNEIHLLQENNVKIDFNLERNTKICLEKNGNTVFSDESLMYSFYEQNRKNDIVWGIQEDKVPVAKKERICKYLGEMSASGLSAIHIMPQGETVNVEYYVEDILEKEVKPLLKDQRELIKH